MRVSGYICKLHRSRAYVSVTLLLVLLGVVALFLGPVGAFALGRYEYIESSLFVLFVVLPFSGVLYLLVASREHWMPNMPMQATREDARA
jgi:NADH:ubiquinone oxidoreductase subunit 3 (subunit A)